jgi:asparagine synthase (glutamine-hydrolysing)
MTAQHVTVALSGEGADEIFGGYQTYIADKHANTARKLPHSMLAALARAADHLPVSDEKIGFDYKLKRFLAGALLTADEAHFYWNGTFSQKEKASLGLRMPTSSAAELCRQLTDIPPSADVVNRYLFADQHYYLPDDILYKCDRMSMAHSLEVRPPFLDHRIVEFAGQLPSDLKISGRRTKHILRELVKDKLPSAILQRRKEGLDIPAQGWLRGPLRPLVEDALGAESVRSAGLFSPGVIESLKQRHFSRQENLGYHLWGLLTLHLWMRRWKIEPTDEPETKHVLSSAHV